MIDVEKKNHFYLNGNIYDEKGCFMRHLILVFVLLVWAPSAISATANFGGISYSISLHPTVTYVQGFPVEYYFTTYDGNRFSLPLYDEEDDYVYFSQELKQDAALYKMDYFAFFDGFLDDYGEIYLNIPYNDSNGNSVDDLCEKSMTFNESITGNWYSYDGTNGTIIGSMSRSENYIGGSYNITAMNTYAGDMNLTGSFYVGAATGTVDYSNSENTISITYSVTFDSQTPPITMETTYEILDQDTIRIYGVDIFPTTEFTRDGNIYSGTVVLADGEPLTSWPDYQRWFLTITDTNDEDGDGIPDLSDSADSVELKAMPWIPLLLLNE
jgi:hypothetical protein